MSERAHPEIAHLMDRNQWFRCEQPERPNDADATYVWSCDGCFLGLIADARVDGDAVMTNHDVNGCPASTTSLVGTLAEATEYRSQEGLSTFGAEAMAAQ